MKEQKFILTDIDGVCFDWAKQFRKFLGHYHPTVVLEDPTTNFSHIKHIMHEFCVSAWMGWCTPLRDSVDVLTKFKEDGYEIHACTAMGFDPYAIALRRINLERFFPNIFSRVDTTEMSETANKSSWLEKYRNTNCIWVEDKWTNAVCGAEMGIKTFLMRQPYNGQYNDARITKVDNWHQIYYYIKNNDKY